MHDFLPWEYNKATDELHFVCPICGCASLPGPPYSPEGNGLHQICSCCGIQYDEEYNKTRHDLLRRVWIGGGMKWRHAPGPPADWNPAEQLKKIGYLLGEADAPSLTPLAEALVQGADALGLALDAATVARFVRFAALLEEGNQRLNLTRIRPEDVVTLHFLDSLALATVHKPAPGIRLLDVGTGAGFPGVPLALVFPDAQVTLLDSTRKRLAWLAATLTDVGVTNAHTLHARAEEIARLPAHHARYDLVVARAVAPLSTLAGWLLPFVRPGGLAVAYKSRDVQAEITAALPGIKALGSRLEQVAEVALPGTDIVRKLVLLRKN